MLKKSSMEVLAVLGSIMVAAAGLSGLFAYLFGSGRTAFSDPTVIWFAPLFLTPLALAGIAMMYVSALVSKKKRALIGWSCLGFVVILAMTAAVFTLTGLSTGETELAGTFWGTAAVVLSLVYALAMLGMSAVGVMVARDIHDMETGHQAGGVPSAST